MATLVAAIPMALLPSGLRHEVERATWVLQEAKAELIRSTKGTERGCRRLCQRALYAS